MNKPLIIQVEDDPNDVFLFGRAFRKAEIAADLRAFGDGEELIAHLDSIGDSESSPPSVVLLDIKLPRKSGFEVLQWVRAHPTFKWLPVVMLTSSAQPFDVRRAYDLGANGYVVKPMDIEDVVALLAAINGFWINVNIRAANTDSNNGSGPSI